MTRLAHEETIIGQNISNFIPNFSPCKTILQRVVHLDFIWLSCKSCKKFNLECTTNISDPTTNIKQGNLSSTIGMCNALTLLASIHQTKIVRKIYTMRSLLNILLLTKKVSNALKTSLTGLKCKVTNTFVQTISKRFIFSEAARDGAKK